MKKICLSLVTNLMLFFLSLQKVRATVIINEVFPNPVSGDSEWVELFNQEPVEINLNSWKLEDQLSSPSTIFTFTNQVLGAKQYLVAQLPSAKLNNDRDGVTLKDQSGNQVDMMSYESSSNNMSLAREEGGQFALGIPSPGAANFSTTTPAPSTTPSPSLIPSPIPSLTPTPVPTPSPQLQISNLQLSEIYACPNTGENEWIEIYNSSNISSSLSNWKIKDSSDNQKTINSFINSHSLAVIEWSGSLLNNDGDSISLIDPNGNLSFTVNFNECLKGQSYIFDNNAWKLTSSPTKNSANILSNPTPTPSPSPSPSTSPDPNSEIISSDNFAHAEINDSPINNNFDQPELSLPDLELQTITTSSDSSTTADSTNTPSSAQLIPSPPDKKQMVGLIGTCVATASGSCWAIFDAQRKRDSS